MVYIVYFPLKIGKGVNLPTGNSEFQFHVVNLTIKRTIYDWLAIAGI